MANLNKGVRNNYVNTNIKTTRTSEYLYEEAYSSASADTSQRVLRSANDTEEATEDHYYEEIPMNEYSEITYQDITPVERLKAPNTQTGSASNTQTGDASNTHEAHVSNIDERNTSNAQKRCTKNCKKTVCIAVVTIFLSIVLTAVVTIVIVSLTSKNQAQSSNIRLSNGTRQDHSNGRLEVFHDNTWGTVCDHNFDNNAATVVCRQLGYTGNISVSRDKAAYGAGTGKIWLDDVSCNGNETDLFTCAHNPWGENDCTHDQDVGVDCNPNINECASGPCKNGGFCTDHVNGFTCTCQQGYTGIKCETDLKECASGPCKNGGFCLDTGNGFTCYCKQGYRGINCEIDINECASEPCRNGGKCADNVDGYKCTCQQGYTGINCEIDINECASGPCKNGGSCTDHVNGFTCTCQQGYTGIKCQTAQNSNIRLSNGTRQDNSNGRLEVFYNNTWGTVCYDSFDNNAATVICRQLGFTGKLFVSRKQAAYGVGTGQIWLDDVTCTGNETDLFACAHNPWGVHNCGHHEDIGVDCNPNADAFVPLRLVNGRNVNEGRVEVQHNGVWGTVCNNGWDEHAAMVACKQILHRTDSSGFPQDHAMATVKTAFYRSCGLPNVIGAIDGTLIPILAPKEDHDVYICRKGYHAINVQAVVDHKMRFTDVVAKWPGSQHDAATFDECGLKEYLEHNDIGVLLGDSGYPLKKYLLTPLSNPTTPQEVRYNESHAKGRTIIEQAFGVLKARFSLTAIPLSTAAFGPGTGTIWLDDVKCTGFEAGLGECTHTPWGDSDCQHSEDVGVMCLENSGPPNVTVQLDGADSMFHGRVEIRVYDMWGTICDDEFGDKEATVICKMLGHHSGGTVLTYGTYGVGRGPIWLDDVKCSGNETTIQDCVHRPWGSNDCEHEEDVAVLCHSVQGPPNVTIQLTGGDSMFHGRVEIQVYDMWGTICRNGFGDNETTVICRMLGHHSGGTLLTGGSDGVVLGGSGPIWLDDVKCSGNETRIQDCVHMPWGSNNCEHDEDISVHCFQGSLQRQNVTVRLSGGASRSEGRLEVFYNNVWGTVCGDFFDAKAAAVVCRMLGLPSSGAQSLPSFYYGSGNGTIWLDDVRCTGNETSIGDCQANPWGNNDCKHERDVGVVCDAVRLCLDERWRHGTSCYYFSNTQGDITSAQAQCNSSRGNLAEIEDDAENSFLQQIVKNAPNNEYYIGLNDVKQEGNYSWFGSNSLLSQTRYKHWDDNEPNNREGGEDCAVMRRNGYWNDVSCNGNNRYGYICEIKD